MESIHVCARLAIAPGRVEEFKQLISAMAKKARELEAGQTTVYEFYLPNGLQPSACLVHEVFVDAKAFRQHIENFQADVMQATDLFRVERSDIWGAVPADLIESMQDEFGSMPLTWYGNRCASM